jgi:prepilin-type processing-associated H-X9-DG protein
MHGWNSGHLRRRPCRHFIVGYTLTELLVVVGMVALLCSLLLPVVGKARAAAQSANCLSNLRQMGNGWTMYTAANRGYLMSYVWRSVSPPDLAYNAYWPGILDSYAVRGDVLLCPSANEPTPNTTSQGYGSLIYAWNGKFTSNGTAIRLNGTNYRTGSYGFNRYLTAAGGFGDDGLATKITAVRRTSEVPLFFDCGFVDARPPNGSEMEPAPAPPNLSGDTLTAGSPEHWNFLLSRHGNGINVAFADGSARWVRLEDTYTLTWKSDWVPYRIPLPSR